MKSLHKYQILGLAAFLFLPLGFYVQKAMAPLTAVIVVFVVVQELFFKRSLKFISWKLYVVALAIPLLGAASYYWSFTPSESLKLAPIIGATILGGILLVNNSNLETVSERSNFETWIIAGGIIGFSFVFIENISDAALSRNVLDIFGLNRADRMVKAREYNSGVSIAALFIWPFALAVSRRFALRFSIPIIAFGLIGIFMGDTTAPSLALVVGFLAFIFYGVIRQKGSKILIGLVFAYTIVAPILPNLLPDPRSSDSFLTKYYSSSDFHRYIIWTSAVDHIVEKPILGSGLDSTRALYSNKDMIRYDVEIKSTGKKQYFLAEPIPLHPHNAILQIWLELGAAGAALLAFFLACSLHYIGKSTQNIWESALIIGLFFTGLTISSLSYGVWQSWWLGSLVIASSLMAAVTRKSPE